jgi:hypothetical protein
VGGQDDDKDSGRIRVRRNSSQIVATETANKNIQCLTLYFQYLMRSIDYRHAVFCGHQKIFVFLSLSL